MFLLGTDEAGYGPNLGPLVISVSAWKIPRPLSGPQLYEMLYPVILPASKKRELAKYPASFLLDDSKKLYAGRHNSEGLKHLEYALLSCLFCLNKIGTAADTTDVYNALCDKNSCFEMPNRSNSRADNHLQGSLFDTVNETSANQNTTDFPIPDWEIPGAQPVPIDAQSERLKAIIESFAEIQKSTGIQLTDLRSDAVFPARFNALCEYWGNKSTLLSKTTLKLLESVLFNCNDITEIWCDKHGGRDRYADLLSHQFQTEISVIEESRSISSYSFNWRGFDRQIHFQAKGDCAPAGALASIACKYLRELFINQLNDYWTKLIPDLLPTAGYPVDAKRFLEDIRPKLNVPLEVLWRNR